MKDPQVTTTNLDPRVPLLSPLLHGVSLTVLVYLRSGFGFAFLRPKSFFLACAWAFGLYALYAWIDGAVWRAHRAVLWFGLGASVLYTWHLAAVLRREWQGTAAHDYFSGCSNLEPLLGGWSKKHRHPVNLWNLCLWGEPLVSFFVALLLRVVFGEHHLSGWLLLASFCLWGKEALNRWFGLRQHKRRQDILEDAEQAFADHAPSGYSPSLQRAARKERVRRPRASTRSSENAGKKR